MKQLSAFLLLVLSFAFLPFQAGAQEEIKVMSYNIRYGTAKDGPGSLTA